MPHFISEDDIEVAMVQKPQLVSRKVGNPDGVSNGLSGKRKFSQTEHVKSDGTQTEHVRS